MVQPTLSRTVLNSISTTALVFHYWKSGMKCIKAKNDRVHQSLLEQAYESMKSDIKHWLLKWIYDNAEFIWWRFEDTGWFAETS